MLNGSQWWSDAVKSQGKYVRSIACILHNLVRTSPHDWALCKLQPAQILWMCLHSCLIYIIPLVNRELKQPRQHVCRDGAISRHNSLLLLNSLLRLALCEIRAAFTQIINTWVSSGRRPAVMRMPIMTLSGSFISIQSYGAASHLEVQGLGQPARLMRSRHPSDHPDGKWSVNQ